MNPFEDMFLKVLRSAMWGHPLDTPKGYKGWKQVLKMAHSQAVIGLVSDRLYPHPHLKLKDGIINNMAIHSLMNNSIVVLVNKLREQGIEPVLLKGQGIASYYPLSHLRACGDIDLYVGAENYEKAYHALSGVVSSIDSVDVLKDKGKHFHISLGDHHAEIHRFSEELPSRLKNCLYQKFALDGLTKDLVPVQINDLAVNTPADTYNAFYIFHHIWVHLMTSGNCLRQYCDLAFLLHAKSGNIDSSKLEFYLRKFCLMEPWKVVGSVLVDFLGLPKEDFPFYDPSKAQKAQKLIHLVLSEEYFMSGNPLAREYKNGFLREKLFSFKCELSRLRRIFPIFPCHTFSRFWYTLWRGLFAFFRDWGRR